MFDKDILKRVKRACIGIGLIAENNSFLKLVGSGFLIEEGYILSTRKILESCAKRRQGIFTETGVKSDIVPVHIIENELKIDLEFIPYSTIMAG